jgi:hypothetical protein
MRMKKRLIVVLVLATLALFVLPACGISNDIKGAGDVGKAFMTALKNGDNQTSWDMSTSDIKDQIGGYDNWVAFTAPRQFEDFTLNSTNIDNDKATLEGEATLAGDTYKVTLILYKSGDTWQVAGLDFSLK